MAAASNPKRCTSSPSTIRPPDRTSIVAAVIAVIVGVRAGIWQIADPSLIVLVCPASQASTEGASDPYASAAHTESYPSRSASRTTAS